MRIATLQEIERYGDPGARERGLLPPMMGGVYPPSGGAWPGIVGSAGYLLCDWSDPTASNVSTAGVFDVSALPAGVTVAYTGCEGFQFEPEPQSAAKYLQNAAGTTGSGGTVFETSSFTIKFTFTNAFSGTISAYACDYDSSGRQETVTDGTTLMSLASGAVFEAGIWMQWFEVVNAAGTVTFTVAPNGGNGQAPISGFFFDNVPTQILEPASDITTTGWTPSTGSTLWGILSDGTDSNNVSATPS